MRICSLKAALFGGLHLLACVYAGALAAMPLPLLVENMQDSPATMAGYHDQQEIGSELYRRQERTGWRLFGGVQAGHYRELEQDGRYTYDGVSAQIGLRYPLLGAMRARRLSALESQVALDKARHNTALMRAEQEQQLRQTYIDWWLHDTLGSWCAQQRSLAASEQEKAARRNTQQYLRRSEHLWVVQRWSRVLHTCDVHDAYDNGLRQQLAYLYGQPLPAAARPHAEPLPVRLAPVSDWFEQLEQHPSLLGHRSEVENLDKLGKQRWSERVESYFSVSQAVSSRSDRNGRGRDTVVALSVDMPLSGLVGARPAQAVGSQQAAHQRMLDTRQQLQHALEKTLNTYQQLHSRLDARQRQLQHTRELVGEQQARLAVDDENGFMNLRLALIEKAETELEVINDWHAAWSTLAQLEVLAGDQLARLRGGQSKIWPFGLELATPARAGANAWGQQAVYVWDSRSLLAPQQRQKQVNALLRNGFNHVYLGFDAAQVRALPQLKAEIRQLLEQLAEQGISAELLLGDPDWLLPEQRSGLLELLQRFAGLPFVGLHLDLEVEQLGWPVPAARLQDWLDTLTEVQTHSPWPVTLVSHHRWFAPEQRDAEHCIPCALPGLGIRQATLMLYSTASESVIRRMQDVLAAWPQLQLHLAQSVEPQLPADNSWHGRSAGQLQELSRTLYQRLAPHGLAGVAWQDWAHYPAPDEETPP